jgi:Ca2+-dependent lipid-binding protein
MDPFVVIEYHGTKYKTCVIQGGGKKPIWNDLFEIEIFGMGDELKVECFDEDIFTHDLVGFATIEVALLCHVTASRKWLPL